jgi:hypothetical protein
MYVPPGSMPNTHGPMRGDVGITSATRDYGPVGSRFSLDPKFAFGGPSDGRKLKWVTWWQSWMKLSKMTPAMMVAAYLKTALEWAFLLPPRGNMPMTIAYFYAAQVEFRKLRRGTAVDFSAVDTFSGRSYREMKDALDWLVAPDKSGTGSPNFMSESLVGSQCMRDLSTQPSWLFIFSFRLYYTLVLLLVALKDLNDLNDVAVEDSELRGCSTVSSSPSLPMALTSGAGKTALTLLNAKTALTFLNALPTMGLCFFFPVSPMSGVIQSAQSEFVTVSSVHVIMHNSKGCGADCEMNLTLC